MNDHSRAFDPAKWQRLESPERRERMNPLLLTEVMAPGPAMTALDIGCGTGFFAEVAAPRLKRLVGLDHAAPMLDVFRSKENFSALKNVELVIAKEFPLPFGDLVFDLVFHVNFFHETGDIPAFHAEIARTLKPGGRLFCVDWEKKETEGGPPLDHRIAAADAAYALKRDGFTVIAHHAIYRDHYVIEAGRER